MQKSTTISLAANVVLAAVVIHLWHELEGVAASSEPGVNVARSAGGPDATNTVIASAVQSSGPADEMEAGDEESISHRPSGLAPERPPVIRRTDVLQARANAKDYFRDFVDYVRLSPEKRRQFYDLAAVYMVDLEEQKNPHSELPREDPLPAVREFKAGLEELLGTAGVTQYEEYDAAGMALLEFAHLSAQLEGRDLPLSEDQRTRLLRAAIEHRQVFTDAYGDAQSFAEDRWVVTPYKADILRLYRLETLALPILTAEQMGSIADLRDTRIALSEFAAAETESGRR